VLSENKIIEVKSTYTASLAVDVQQKKKEACLKKGHSFETIIY